MDSYRFEHREPLTQRVVLALRVDTKQMKEQLWLGTEYEGAESGRFSFPTGGGKCRPVCGHPDLGDVPALLPREGQA